jgi:hypothetical protein
MKTVTFGLKSLLVWLIFDESLGEFNRKEWICKKSI